MPTLCIETVTLLRLGTYNNTALHPIPSHLKESQSRMGYLDRIFAHDSSRSEFSTENVLEKEMYDSLKLEVEGLSVTQLWLNET